MAKDIDPAAYDRWLLGRVEYPDEVEYEDCPDCEGDGLDRYRAPDGGEDIPLDEPCARCGGEAQIEVDQEEKRARLEDERAQHAEDKATERYYHDKYGD